MNVNTGEIINAAMFEKLPKEARSDYEQIPHEKLAELQSMNRHQRRAWAAQQRKARTK